MVVTIKDMKYDLKLKEEKSFHVEQIHDVKNIIRILHPATKISELVRFCLASHEYLKYLPYSPVINDIIELWLCSLRKVVRVWKRITLLKDYNLQRFQKRTFPYFKLDHKEWKDASQKANAYPREIQRNFDEIDSDEDVPSNTKDNNFMSIKYTDVMLNTKEILSILSYIKKIDKCVHLHEASLFLVLHPATCHIVAEPAFWALFTMDAEDKHIFNYVLFYAMYILRHEDTTLFTKVSKRTLFTHAQYTSLPVINSNMELNPYLALLANKKYITQRTPWFLPGKRVFTTITEFHRRFHLITGGCLEGLNLKEHSACVAGSILYPCLVKSPLEKNFKDISWDIPNFFWRDGLLGVDHAFLHYMEFYYPSYASLIDSDYNSEIRRPNDVVIEQKATLIHTVSTEKKDRSVKKKLDLVLSDIDIAISTTSFREFIDNAFSIFKHIKSRCVKPVYLSKVNTNASFKFAISGPGIIRPIEIFRVYCTHAQMTKKFHMPNVRAYFDGTPNSGTLDGLYAHRSFIAASISGINEDYKWFSCNKVPIDTIFKNIQRGNSVILNDKELKTATTYLKTSSKWLKMTIGCVNRRHTFFSDSESGIRRNLRKLVLPHQRIDTTTSVTYKPTLTQYDKILAAKNNSSLKPPNLDIIRAYVDYKKEQSLLKKIYD